MKGAGKNRHTMPKGSVEWGHKESKNRISCNIKIFAAAYFVFLRKKSAFVKCYQNMPNMRKICELCRNCWTKYSKNYHFLLANISAV